MRELWEEMIEFSTYGPAERLVLKERRAAAAAASKAKDTSPTESDYGQPERNNTASTSSKSLSVEAFQSAKAAFSEESYSARTISSPNAKDADKNNSADGEGFDGYALRDLLIEKWGVPLDVDFHRGLVGSDGTSSNVYVTVLPVAFGNNRICRHLTELDYLMHLQAVIEILEKYDNLEPWLQFLETTKQSPKPGTVSVPYRLQLSPKALKDILGSK